MRTRSQPRPTSRLPMVLLVPLTLVLTACTSSGGASVPDDFIQIEQEEFAFAVPSTWEVRVDQPEDVQVVGTAQVGDSVEAVDAKAGNYQGNDLRLAAQGALDIFRLGASEDFETVDERDVDVAGADEAVLFESTYAATLSEGLIRQWDVFASTDDSTRLVYLSLKAPDEVFDEALMGQVLDSLEVRL